MTGEPWEWRMPPELEPFRDTIANTGGNTVERLMGLWTNPDGSGERLARTNQPLYLLMVLVAGQVELLSLLWRRGLLAARPTIYAMAVMSQLNERDYRSFHRTPEGAQAAADAYNERYQGARAEAVEVEVEDRSDAPEETVDNDTEAR